MPMPTPRDGESRSDWTARCMADAVMQDDYDEDQRMAVCSSIWQEKATDVNGVMLAAIKLRQQKQTEFGYGILTADRYVDAFRDCVGLDGCYRYASKGRTSFDDVYRRAASTLVYSNEEMVVEVKDASGLKDLQKRFDFPKDTLMAFQHILTTPKRDRDGDVLRTEGATLDPRMLLLWQHVPTLPIGKMVGVVKHTKDYLKLVSAIVDINEISHDGAVMIDNDMGRFSHGFRALEFEEMKSSDGELEGFDVKRFEIMEESLVSVPSNVDAEQEEVLLSLVDGGKLTSPLMKRYGKTIREHRRKTVPVGIDLQHSTDNKEIQGDLSNRSSETAGGEAGRDSSPSAQADDEAGAAAGEKGSEDAKGGIPHDEVTVEQQDTVKEVDTDVKQGRVLSKANESKIRDAADAIVEVVGMDIPRPAKAMLREAASGLKAVLASLGPEEEPGAEMKLAVEAILFRSTKEQRQHLLETLHVISENERQAKLAKQIHSVFGGMKQRCLTT